ncbi:MAG: sigma 54-interacting transcriptional regulator [Deltaproteobacteria bacterium]|nr:sigma 54-interacting transcriptional regulator [Deltaproteobacteria bacterium]
MDKKPTYEELLKRVKQLEKNVEESKRVAKDLEKEKKFSEKVLSSLPGIFYLYDEDGNIVRWNKNHEILTGFSAEEISHRKILDWFNEEEKKYIAARVKETFTRGNSDAEGHLLIKSGEKVPYYFTAMRMINNNRKYLLGMGTDLSKLKKTEDELRESEEKYRQIFENAVDGIYQTTPQGRFVSANPAMARILGYDSAQELMATVKNISKQLYISKKVRDDFIRLLKTQKEVSGFETQFYRKDGTQIWVSVHARLVFDREGTLILIEGIMTDITQQKRETEELQQRESYLREENIRLRSNIKDRYKFGNIIGKSPAMQEVYELILKAAVTDANVIVYGESGTGKEMVAGEIHEMGDRKGKKFVPVHCGAIPENLMESEFFGYRKGAFTGANADKSGYFDIADGGTLFLDELGEISLNMQVKLLRVLESKGYTPVGANQEKNSDVRIIAATNRNLEKQIEKGLMREDFFYRIHILPINLPPLRKRREDIPLLVDYFINLFAKGKSTRPLSGKMHEVLLNYSWPGNVRELQNVIYRYLTLNQFDIIPRTETEDSESDEATKAYANKKNISFRKATENFEKNLLVEVLEANQWHREKAAASLELPPRTFYRKIKRHGL